jgi:hypothetical protein
MTADINNPGTGGFGIDDKATQLQQLADRFAESMGHQFDEPFDFSPDSLIRLDGGLAQWLDLSEPYRGEDPSDVLSFALPIAAYVGEVMRRNLAGAEWITVEEAGQISPPHLRLGNGMRINVMKKAIQTLTGADTPAFATYYQTVSDLASVEPSDEASEEI